MTNFNKTIGKRRAYTAGVEFDAATRFAAYCCAYGQWRMTVEASREWLRDENMRGRIYPGSVAFLEELSPRWESESEPTALPVFPYNQLQLG